MTSRHVAMALALTGLLAPAAAEVRELAVDPLTSAEQWQIGGHRINYSLGSSSLAVSTEQARDGAEGCLRLTYDFTDERRSHVSAYHVGDPIPGVCRELSLWVYGDGSGRNLRLSIEDARGRWFERDLGAIEWEGWQRVEAPVGDGADWRALMRRGEARLPLLHPVNLRQIAVLRKAEAAETGALHFHDLRATTDVVPADFVRADLTTEHRANLFDVGEPAEVSVKLTNAADAPVEARLIGALTDFFGETVEQDLGNVSLPAGGSTERRLAFRTQVLGTHDLEVRLETPERERLWFGRLAVTRPARPRRPDPDAQFGCMYNLTGFSAEDMPTVLRLNRDAGLRWARIGFQWRNLNPAPGAWAWDPPQTTDGPQGGALEPAGQTLLVPHSPALDCTEAVTIAFWARAEGSNGSWQTVLSKWSAGSIRNYGVYFHRDTGEFCFTASFSRQPPGAWKDANSGVSAWDGQWHHYAATYSEADRRIVLYVDGTIQASEAYEGGELRTNGAELRIGTGYAGALDEVLLYRWALEPDEVARLAAKSRPPTVGLVAWWPFDKGDGLLRDRSGSGLDLAATEPAGPRTARLALENGIKTLGLLGFPPTWASTAPEGAARPHTYKPDLDAWANFVEGVTRHYRDLVQHWEIWNEPNISVFWEPEPSAADYLEVLKVGYEAAKRGNPDCTVLMPGLAGPGQNRWGMAFLDELLGMGAAEYCDAISIHPYRQSTPEESDLVGDLEHIATVAEAHGGRRPIWFTENCWTTQIPTGSTDRRQALMLPRCYVLALGTGLMERLLWFRFHDPGNDRFYLEHNCGLCTNDLTPRPSYFAHRAVATLLDGAEAEGEWDVGRDAMARCFRHGKRRIAAIWCPEGTTPVSVFAGRPRVDAVDIMGNERRLPTRDGVLLVEATEATLFLTDLPSGAEGRGTVVAAEAPALIRGGTGDVTVNVRNPFPQVERALLSLDGPSDLGLPASRGWLDVPGNESREMASRISASPTAQVGWHSLSVALEFAGETFRQEVPVAVRSAAPDAGPVGHWRLDEGAGTVIRDTSGNGNHGTVEQPQWVPGKQGTALRFDGTYEARVPHSPSLSLPDEVTIAFWLKLLGRTGTWQLPVSRFAEGGQPRNYGIYLSLDRHEPCFTASFAEAGYRHTDVRSSVPVDDGEWHHVAAAYSMFEQRLGIYVDGEAAADVRLSYGAMTAADGPLRIGAATQGMIDEVMVYPRALSVEEVAELAR